MTLTIRLARAEDAAALTDLSLRSKQSNGYDDAFMAACREELTVTPADMAASEYWIAVEGGIVGCAALDGAGVVHAFFIDPARKRQGIGRALWAKLLERAAAHGVDTLSLDADPAAVPFYQALGFSITAEVPSGSIPGRVIPRMERRV